MPEHEKIINFRYDRAKAQIVRLIAGKNLIEREGELRPATVSDVLRGLLDTWLDEHAFEYYPQLIEEFKQQGIDNPAVKLMKEFLHNAEALDKEIEEEKTQ